MAVPSESWSVITSGQVDADSPLDETLMEAIRGNLIHVEEWLGLSYTAAQDHDHDDVNSKAVVKVAADTITPVELKFSTGTWDIDVAATSYDALAMVEYSHYPKMQSDTGVMYLFGGTTGHTMNLAAEDHRIWVYNANAAQKNWTGTYTYHSASEQIVVVRKNDVGEITGVHVTENGNENSLFSQDEEGIIIPTISEILTISTNPSLFVSSNEKRVKSNASSLKKDSNLLKIEVPII